MVKDNFIKQVWDVWVENKRTRKALRVLNKQEWSIEFLTSLLRKAAALHGQHLEMQIISPNGAKIVVKTVDTDIIAQREENIFDHLDDDIKIRQFMENLKK